mmetsp:Transcript_8314/g.16580  ORF Transcript_8314/g.16580 Transcript_8314/m.16580 type:complete len:350 (-) Transcript_8314:623-1672(-)
MLLLLLLVFRDTECFLGASRPVFMPKQLLLVIPMVVGQVLICSLSGAHPLLIAHAHGVGHLLRDRARRGGIDDPSLVDELELVPLPRAVVAHFEEMLLRANNAAGADNAQPCNAFVRAKVQVLHHPERDERARPAEACFAVHGDEPLLCIANIQEFLYNFDGWNCAIVKVEVDVLDPVLDEDVAVVLLLVEANDRRDVNVVEDGHVEARVEVPDAHAVEPLPPPWEVPCRALERHQLVRHYHVQVAVPRVVVVLVLLKLKVARAQPPEGVALGQPVPAVYEVQMERRLPERGVTVRLKRVWLDIADRRHHLLPRHPPLQYQKGSQKKNSVGARPSIGSTTIHEVSVGLS